MSHADNDQMISLAFSIHSAPGVYSLLIGSGVSKAAGIPTGQDVTNELLKKYAALKGVPVGTDPRKWYEESTGGKIEYSSLIDLVAPGTSERRNLLKSYFEPNEDDRAEGKKIPTSAHRAIAQLVKKEKIKMIITTNFDQLIETALREIDIHPVIIDSDDKIKGASPYVHNNCTIVKINGDYLDTRIKNTEAELAKYSNELQNYLDDVLDKFGLIVCGWSATSDLALKDSLFKRANRRYCTYWTTRTEPEDDAKRIIDHLDAQKIMIQNADDFFSELSEKIDALDAYNKSHPLSVDLAVLSTKKYLSEDKYTIKLHDLLMDEISNVKKEIASNRFDTPTSTEWDHYREMARNYESLVEMSSSIIMTIAKYGGNKNHKLITDAINHLLSIKGRDGVVVYDRLRIYPSWIIFYISGIMAIKNDQWELIRALMNDLYIRDGRGKESGLEVLNTLYLFPAGSRADEQIVRSQTRWWTPANMHLQTLLRDYFKNEFVDEDEMIECFDIFEYILALCYIDHDQAERPRTNPWAPVGSFFGGIDERKENSPPLIFLRKNVPTVTINTLC